MPFVFALAVSGGIYLFKPQIDQAFAQPRQTITPTETRSTPKEQIIAALAAVPDAELDYYELPRSDNQAITIGLRQAGTSVLVYVNPFTAEVMGKELRDEQFIRLVHAFHGELLMGSFGSMLVELAACWAIVLVATGVYLWWPRESRGFGGVLYPRLRRSHRLFWRDLHSVVGFWIAAFTLFLLISGLPWALVWGTAFKEVRKWAEPQTQQDWTASGHEHHHGNLPTLNEQSTYLSPRLLASAQSLAFAAPAQLSPSPDDPGVWALKSQHQNRPLRAEAWLHGESGEVLRVQRFADRPLVDRIIGFAIAAHEGQLFGWFNQILGLLTALGLVTLTVSGCLMWWKRKPIGALGAPPAPANTTVARVVATVILISSLLLPLLLFSLLLVSVVEWLLLRRIAALRTWLGLGAIES